MSRWELEPSTPEVKSKSGSADIIEKYQKVRYDQLKKNVKSGKSMLNDLVKKDVKICGREILSCCQGEFPKSS